jgi:hypothetical protein
LTSYERSFRTRRVSSVNKVLRDIETDGGPSASAMHEWFYGKTLRPQNPAVEAAGRALRWYRSWKRMPSDMK